MLVARCRICGAPMFSKESLATGIGPKCRGQQKKKDRDGVFGEIVTVQENTNH
ncbi:DUF6011 domain-containing protein [Arthrobacter sp. G.S.26]|uniref:DUF6011 domain-containing protein n=1 Tax=Arthrobacter sp. G.S.26 TaxID=3433706 RepID=UPI003D789E3E